MKNYRQLIKELPSKTLVMSIGSFNPPTVKHEMTFKLVEKLVHSHNADHVIYITEDKNSLPVERKEHFLELMFNDLNFSSLKEEQLAEEISGLKKKYKNIVIVTSEDKVKSFEKALTSKLFESVQVISTGDSNPDVNKIKQIVAKGDYTSFKKNMPSSFRDIDAKRLMNEMRQAQGLEFIKEEVKFSVDTLREKYFKGEIYQIGDLVESAGQQYEIMDRGSNYLVVVNSTGDLSRKWVKDVTLVEAVKKAAGGLKKACWKGYTAIGTKKKNGRTVPNCVPESVLNPANPHDDYKEKSKNLQDLSRNKDVDQKAVQQRRLDLDKEYSKHKQPISEDISTQLTYKGYTTKNFHHCADTSRAFKMSVAKSDIKDPVAMLNAIKTTDTYLKINDPAENKDDMTNNKIIRQAHIKAKESLVKVGEFHNHSVHWEKHKQMLDKIMGEHFDNNSLAQTAMTYGQYMKAKQLNKFHVTDQKQIKTPVEPNISQQIDDLQDWPFEKQTEAGYTLDVDRQLRRRKAMYATEAVQGDLMDEDFATKFVAEGSGEVGDEIGNDKVVKIKTLPPELAPPKDSKEPGAAKDKGFSAFYDEYEAAKKKAQKENVDFDFTDFMKRRINRE